MTQTLIKTVANFESSLNVKLAPAGTSLTLVSANDSDGNALAAGTYGFTISEGESNEEHVIGVVSGTTVSSLIRNVKRNDGTTAQTGKDHRKGASIKITNFPAIQRIQRILNGTVDLDANTPLSYDGNPSFGSGTPELATVKLVEDTANAGAADASTTVKGISEEATEAEVVAGDVAGGTSARLFVNPGSIVDKILTALERTWVRAIEGVTTPTEVNQLAGTTNVAEADTFFGASDISGAEAETLTDGSDAATLHRHTNQSEKLEISTTQIVIADTNTETNLISVSIPANTLGTNNGIKVRIFVANLASGAANNQFTLKLKYGSTILITKAFSGEIGDGVEGYIDLYLFGSGAAGTQKGYIKFDLNEDELVEGTTGESVKGLAIGTATEDSTGALNLVVTFQWATAQASNTITAEGHISEIITT